MSLLKRKEGILNCTPTRLAFKMLKIWPDIEFIRALFLPIFEFKISKMKKLFLLFLLISSLSGFSQEKGESFKTGIQKIDNDLTEAELCFLKGRLYDGEVIFLDEKMLDLREAADSTEDYDLKVEMLYEVGRIAARAQHLHVMALQEYKKARELGVDSSIEGSPKFLYVESLLLAQEAVTFEGKAGMYEDRAVEHGGKEKKHYLEDAKNLRKMREEILREAEIIYLQAQKKELN